MVFRCLIFKEGCNSYIFGMYIFFIYFFMLALSRSLESCFFVKCYITTNLHVMESWNVYSEGFGEFTVSNKYSLLSGIIQLGSLLFWYVNIYWAIKYLELAQFRILFCEHFFRILESKGTMG